MEKETQNSEHLNQQFQSYDEVDGISLKEIITVLWNWKWVLIGVTFFGLVLSIVIGSTVNSLDSKVSTIIELQWNGISNGELPDGKRFDYGNMFESYVYATALDEANITEISTNELRRNIVVTPLIPDNVVELIENALRRGEQVVYFPTEFKITLNNGDLGISVEQSQKILNVLIDEFRNDFEKKYIQRAIILDYTSNELDSYDYIQAHEILLTQYQLINDIVNTALPQGNNFISTQLGIGFSNIIVRNELVKSIELDNMESRINNYLLSKDKDLLITILTYRIELFQLELNKSIEVEAELIILLDTYKGSTATIIIPGLDSSNFLDTEPYLSTLYDNIVRTQSNISTLQQDIIFYETRIERLKGNDPGFIITPEKEASEIAFVEASIARTGNVYSGIISDLDIILTEYNQFLTRGLIKPLMAPQYEPPMSILIFGAIGIVIGGMTGVGVVFLIDFNAKKRLDNCER